MPFSSKDPFASSFFDLWWFLKKKPQDAYKIWFQRQIYVLYIRFVIFVKVERPWINFSRHRNFFVRLTKSFSKCLKKSLFAKCLHRWTRKPKAFSLDWHSLIPLSITIYCLYIIIDCTEIFCMVSCLNYQRLSRIVRSIMHHTIIRSNNRVLFSPNDSDD